MKYKPGTHVDYNRGDMITTGHVVKSAPNGTKLEYGETSITGVEGVVKETALTYTKGVRRALPDERKGLTHGFRVGDVKFFIKTGEYEDGTLGEFFLTVAKEGDCWRAYDLWATSMSMNLQYNIPGILETQINKFKHARMEPSGVVIADDHDPVVKIAKSAGDYVANWLEKHYLVREKPLPNLDDKENKSPSADS